MLKILPKSCRNLEKSPTLRTTETMDYTSISHLYSMRENQNSEEKLVFLIFNYVICSLFCKITTKFDIE